MSTLPHALSQESRRRIAEIDKELSELRPETEALRAELARPGAAEKLLETMGSVLLLVEAFGPGDSGEKAIYLIGRLRGVLSDVARRNEVLNQAELLRERRRKLEAGL